jgi:hypothetical protein
MSGEHWWDDHRNIATLLRWMHQYDEDGPLEPELAIAIVEKPWKYDDEWLRCQEGNRPPNFTGRKK